MTDVKDAGVIATLMERHEKYRLPRLLDIKSNVDSGAKLNDAEIAFLEEVVADIDKIGPLIERHPEYQSLFSRVTDLYKEITARALENEK